MDSPPSALRAAFVESKLGALLPLRADPLDLCRLVDAYRETVLPTRKEDSDARRRWEQVEGALRTAGATGGTLPRSRWHREPAGRLHATQPAAQCVPGFVRAAFVPEGVFLDCDLVTAHPAIAAVRSGDARLLDDIYRQHYYEGLAEEVIDASRPFGWADGVEVRHLRATIKRVVCAFVNGGGPGTSTIYLGRAFRKARSEATSRGGTVVQSTSTDSLRGIQRIGKWFYQSWWYRYPKLSAWGTAVAKSWSPGTNRVTTLTGRELLVPADDWRTILSAQYSSVEAEILDLVLVELFEKLPQYSAGIALPLYDGLLIDTPLQHASPLSAYVESVMRWAAAAAGVPQVGVKVVTQKRWGQPLT